MAEVDRTPFHEAQYGYPFQTLKVDSENYLTHVMHQVHLPRARL